MSNPTALSPRRVQASAQQDFAASCSNDNVNHRIDRCAENLTYQETVEPETLVHCAEVRQFFQSIVNLFATLERFEDFLSINSTELPVKWTGHGTDQDGCAVTFKGFEGFEGFDLSEVKTDGKIQSLRRYWSPAEMPAAQGGD